MTGLVIGAASAAVSYTNSAGQSSRAAASEDVPPMHDAVFESAEVAIAHEQAAYASHGIAVSKEYATYLCYVGLSNPQGGAALSPEEWEAKNKPKVTSSKDNNLLINSLSTSAALTNKEESFKTAPVSILKTKLDIFYSQFDSTKSS